MVSILCLPGCPEEKEEAGWETFNPSVFGPGAGSGGGQTTAPNDGQDAANRFGEKDGVAPDGANITDSQTTPEADTGDTKPKDTSEAEPEDVAVIPQPDVDTYVAVPTDIEFEDPDTGCTPQCEGKLCGSDECGSVCGFCEYGKACDDDGQCIPICDPITPCLGKDCGADGCGGTCGDCPASFACGSDDGLCYESDCEPQCEEKECGPDLCGGVCGTCGGTKLCDTDLGECVSNPCGNVDFKGACADKTTVVQCVDGDLQLTDCAEQNPILGCVWNPISFTYGCDVLPNCTPDCSGKQCGDGGCSYSCGDCFNGWSCIDFQCTPEIGGQCGTVPEVGLCIQNDLYFCSGGLISIEPCNELGKTCQFNPATASNACL